MIMQRFQRWKAANLRKWRMLRRLGIAGGALAVVALGFASWPADMVQTALAQTAGGRAQALITQAVNDGSLFRLAGNIPRAARNAANDRGGAPDAMPMPNMLLQLRRPAAQEQALTTLIEQLHNPNSPNYHQWLSAEQLGAQFGPAASDIQTITDWLQQHGFTVNAVLANRMAIDFSGTAGQVRTALHADIHYLDVNGVRRFANVNDPQIPAALAAAVVGVAGLHDIPPKPMMRRTPTQYSPSGFVCGPGFAFPCELVTPSDLATIYNFNPLFAAGTTGQGQTIYLIEDTDLYTNNDWTTFRSTFGIPASSYPGASLTTVNPGNCAHNVNGDDGEAILDAEYASAGAPGAAIVIASCTSLLLAIQRVVNGTNPPPIMSISYGNCESDNGAAFNQALSTAYQTGVAAGMSIFVSSGDGGADSCDNHDTATSSTSGISASGFATTPYNVAVGGTDFSDAYSNVIGTYWNSSNSPTYGSAKSYIPEIPWNNSCGSELYASHYGFATTYGPGGLCNSSTASSNGLLNIGAGSGSPSSCATGSGASCQGWPKPSWQSGLLGNPADGVRDVPDVSLFSAAGAWGHFYIFCYSDPNNGGSPCTGSPINWSGAGGTSFASPIWAGIQALVNQYSGARQGNPNPVLYKIAATEYGASGSSNCNASNGNTIGSSCIFYDVTLGDMVVDCTSGTPNCYAPGGTYGVLSTSTSSYAPAFKTNTGWDFATGIGTVNVYNLVTNWVSTGGGNTNLTVSVTGSGTVSSNPAGISCPSTCSHAFAGGSQVTLTPTPASGWAFSSWGGACSGSGGCTVTIAAGASVTATFVQNVTLSVSVTGSGSVTSSPTGINCPSTCSASFAGGTQVTLTATPADGSGFEGWGGACSGFDNCVVTMSSAQSVTATFAQTQYTLNVSVAGNGTVTSSPSGISCPSLCTNNYASGTPVTLTASPAGGATFNGWGGACSGNGSCSVTMNSLESVTAMFSASGGGGGPAVANFCLGDLGQRHQSVHARIALPDLRRGAGADHRRRRDCCPRSGRFRPGDHHQGGHHLQRRNQRRRHDALPRHQRHRCQRRGRRHDLSARPDLRRRQCVRHLRHRVLERRAAANRKLPGPGLHHVRHHVVSRCRQRRDATPDRSQHDDPQQRDRHLDPADRRHRGKRLAAMASHRQQYRRRTAGRRHRRLRRDQCHHHRQHGELQRRQRHRRGQRPGQRDRDGPACHRGLEWRGRHSVESSERRHRQRHRERLDALCQRHRHPGDRRRQPAHQFQ